MMNAPIGLHYRAAAVALALLQVVFGVRCVCVWSAESEGAVLRFPDGSSYGRIYLPAKEEAPDIDWKLFSVAKGDVVIPQGRKAIVEIKPISDREKQAGLFRLIDSPAVIGVVISNAEEEDVCLLQECTNLRYLRLENFRMDGAECHCLDRMVNIRYLELIRGDVKNGGLGCLRDLGQMEGLDLYGASIEDSDLSVLPRLRKLEKLRLGNTRITDRGIIVYVSNVSDLRQLDVAYSRVSDKGLEALARLKNLQFIVANNTMATGSFLLSPAWQETLRGVNLSGNQLDSSFGNQLTQLRSLEELVLRECEVEGALDIDVELPKLEYLVLGHTKISNRTLESICRAANLKELDLSFTMKRIESLEIFSGLIKLRKLNLSGMVIDNFGGYRPSNLSHLDVMDSKIDLEDLRAIATFPRLKELSLCGLLVEDSWLPVLCGSKSIESLNLMACKIGDKDLMHLTKIESLKRIDVSFTSITSEAVQSFRKMRPDCVVISD